MLTPAELKSLLQRHHLHLTKRLGQHHLVDARAVERIIEGCEVSPRETVVDIGAGLGALTEPLAQRAGRVIAVEVDRRICDILTERMRSLTNVTVVCDDILTFDWRQHPDAVVVGAIPYHITSPILVALSEARQLIRRAILVIQEEVAQRLVAEPGAKAYGRLSVLGQYRWEITTLLRVPRRAFFPQPAVDSTCLRVVPRRAPPVALRDERRFFDLVAAAFAHRRKTLVNCLSAAGLLERSRSEVLLTARGLPVSVRGEALSLEQFASLANALAHC